MMLVKVEDIRRADEPRLLFGLRLGLAGLINYPTIKTVERAHLLNGISSQLLAPLVVDISVVISQEDKREEKGRI